MRDVPYYGDYLSIGIAYGYYDKCKTMEWYDKTIEIELIFGLLYKTHNESNNLNELFLKLQPFNSNHHFKVGQLYEVVNDKQMPWHYLKAHMLNHQYTLFN